MPRGFAVKPPATTSQILLLNHPSFLPQKEKGFWPPKKDFQPQKEGVSSPKRKRFLAPQGKGFLAPKKGFPAPQGKGFWPHKEKEQDCVVCGAESPKSQHRDPREGSHQELLCLTLEDQWLTGAGTMETSCGAGNPSPCGAGKAHSLWGLKPFLLGARNPFFRGWKLLWSWKPSPCGAGKASLWNWETFLFWGEKPFPFGSRNLFLVGLETLSFWGWKIFLLRPETLSIGVGNSFLVGNPFLLGSKPFLWGLETFSLSG